MAVTESVHARTRSEQRTCILRSCCRIVAEQIELTVGSALARALACRLACIVSRRRIAMRVAERAAVTVLVCVHHLPATGAGLLLHLAREFVPWQGVGLDLAH